MNPKRFIWMFDRLLPSLKDKRVKYLNISIQSTSPKILKSMKREINTEDLKLKLIQLRDEANHLIIRTHYMVGFPGETWLDFLRILSFSFKVKNFKYLTFIFDPKPGTEAATMKKQVSPAVKKLRFYILKTWAKLGSKLYDDGETY
jgi:tRNA A37 methylthiotransferase MiaB